MNAASTKATAARRRNRSPAGDGVVVDARAAVETARKHARKAAVVGFGCPALDWPHHIRVVIPGGRTEDIRLVEDFGIVGHAAGRPDELERCSVPRSRWNAMAEPAKQDMNARLREKDLPSGRWQTGDNKVERILGTELLTLAWAVAAAEETDVAAVIATWVSLQSAERLWLAGRVLANPTDRVRQGLSLLMSAGPVTSFANPAKPPPSQKGIGGLPLFEKS